MCILSMLMVSLKTLRLEIRKVANALRYKTVKRAIVFRVMILDVYLKHTDDRPKDLTSLKLLKR